MLAHVDISKPNTLPTLMDFVEPSSEMSAFAGGKLLLFCSTSLSFDNSTMEVAVQLFDIVDVWCKLGSKFSSKTLEDRTFRTTSFRVFWSVSEFHSGTFLCHKNICYCCMRYGWMEGKKSLSNIKSSTIKYK